MLMNRVRFYLQLSPLTLFMTHIPFPGTGLECWDFFALSTNEQLSNIVSTSINLCKSRVTTWVWNIVDP